MHSALIIGGNSAIGSALAKRLHADGIKVETTSRSRLDLAAMPERWPDLPACDVAYLCAAITSLETCENDPVATARINVTHTQALAQRLLSQGSHVIFLSSNQVFDGSLPYRKASEAPCPVNAYGRQKAAMEQWLLPQSSAAVLRLTKVVASPLPILEKWTKSLQEGTSIEAFADLLFAPLPLADAVEALVHIGNHRACGIFQLSGARDISYYALACALAAKLRFPKDKVIATRAEEAGIRSIFLPKHATLEPSPVFAHYTAKDPIPIVL